MGDESPSSGTFESDYHGSEQAIAHGQPSRAFPEIQQAAPTKLSILRQVKPQPPEKIMAN
jgi:hypothetical protein